MKKTTLPDVNSLIDVRCRARHSPCQPHLAQQIPSRCRNPAPQQSDTREFKIPAGTPWKSRRPTPSTLNMSAPKT